MLPPLHPLHAIFLASALPLFLGALFSDIAYVCSYEVQWKNFASWLLVGGLAMTLVTLVWAIADFLSQSNDRGARRLVYLASLLVMWSLGFVNGLVHAGDAWGSMPAGLILSVIVSLLSLAAVYLGFSNYRSYRARVPA